VLCEDHRIVSSSARHAARGGPLGLGGVGEQVLELGIERGGLLPVSLGHLEPELLFLGDLFESVANEPLRSREGLGNSGAHIDRQVGGPRNDVEPPGGNGEDPDVRRHVPAGAGLVSQRENDPRCAGQRVTARGHRRRSGMVGLAGQAHAETQ
jgi:hypothetical protein